MRPAFALAATLAYAAASSASAQQVQDRYGPPRTLRTASLSARYEGPMLNWAGRSLPQPPSAPASSPEPAPSLAPQPPAPPRAPFVLRRLDEQSAPAAPRPAAQPPAPTAEQRSAPAPAVQPAPRAADRPAASGAGPRFYSLHREFGLAPDVIPEQPRQPRYVLIGPPDDDAAEKPQAKSAEDDDPSS